MGAQIVEAWSERQAVGLAFDGRVVEVFGIAVASSAFRRQRFHLREVTVDVGRPNRKGRTPLELRGAAGGAGTKIEVESADWAAFEAVLEAIAAARASLSEVRA